MAETLLFELVSPERLLFSEQAEMVVVPGTNGHFGAMPRHAPLISTLEPGVIDVYNGGVVTARIFVTGGVAEVNETGCTVLAEEALSVADLTSELVQARVAREQSRLDSAEDDLSRAQAEKALKAALAMQAALEGGAAH